MSSSAFGDLVFYNYFMKGEGVLFYIFFIMVGCSSDILLEFYKQVIDFTFF